MGLATLYRSQGRDAEARAVLGGLIAAEPRPTADTYWTVVRTFPVLGDVEAARQWAGQARARVSRRSALPSGPIVAAQRRTIRRSTKTGGPTMRHNVLRSIAVLVALAASSPAWAQTREGFWFGFAGGYGSAVSACESCEHEREGAFAGSVKLGGTLSQHLLLGVETNVWTRKRDDTRLSLGIAAGTLTFYPSATSGFFLKGGVGMSFRSVEIDRSGFEASASWTDLGFLAGIGVDIPLGDNVSLTPSVQFHTGTEDDDIVADGGLGDAGWTENVVSFRLGLTFH